MEYLFFIVGYLSCHLIMYYRKRSKPSKNQKAVIFEFHNEVLRKRGDVVWAMYENIPQKFIINSVRCTDTIHGCEVDYNLRFNYWSEGCIGIDKISKHNIYDSREELIKSIL